MIFCGEFRSTKSEISIQLSHTLSHIVSCGFLKVYNLIVCGQPLILGNCYPTLGYIFAYSNAISTNSPMFCYESCSSSGPQHYYEPIQVSVSTTTNVTFTCNSTTFIHGHLYEADFNPNQPQRYLLVGTGYSSAQQRFNVTRRLVASKVYILVITTYFQRDTGSFWVIASSPVVVDMTRMSE